MFYHAIVRRLKIRLIPTIREMVPQGAIIYSDELASYRCLSHKYGYDHHTVNHSDGEFVREEVDGEMMYYVHINTAEAYNRCLKAKFKKISTRNVERIKEEYHVFNWRHSTDFVWAPFCI